VRYITSAERIGLEKGIQQGMQQGMQQGEAILFTVLLKQKFKKIPKNYLDLIQQATTDELQAWCRKVLDAKSLEDIFNS
jgi:flagellar biosynthesis/type III secretory pathway protein FliH